MKLSRRILPIATLLLVPHLASPQIVNGRFSSSVYTWEKFDTVDVSKVILRGFQTLQMEVREGDLSLQTYLVGAMNFNERFGDEGNVRVNNAFLRWKNIGDVVDLSIGRIPVFAGVGNGLVDGILIKGRSSDGDVAIVAYTGANVRPDVKSTGFDGLNENLLVGGQIVGNIMRDLRMGISYVRRNIKQEPYTAFRPDSLFNPAPVLVSPDARAEQIIGLDARYTYTSSYALSTYGRYDYDLYSKRSLRAQLSGRFTTAGQLSFTADYIYREPRIFYNSFFTLFPMSAVREYEGGVEYYFVEPSVRVYGKFAHVQYSGDASRRYTLGASTDWGSASYSGTTGYAGQLHSLYAQVMYPLLDRKLIPTLGLSYGSYRQLEGVSTSQEIFGASLGAVVRLQPDFSVDAQVQWLRNPVASGDVRLFGKVNYWFNKDLNLFD